MENDFNLPWEKIHGQNILVTGASGLIGFQLIEFLMTQTCTNFNVYVACRNTRRARKVFGEYLSKPNFKILQYDVNVPLDGDVCFHYIIHAASNASPNYFVNNPVDVMLSNIDGVKNLLDYGKSHEMKRFLYVSTGEVYGNGDIERWHENESGMIDSMKIRACYPMSKRAAETLCVAYANQFGLDVVVARPCHTYGANFTDSDNRAYAQFLRKAINHENIVLKSKGEQYRSWIYVKDCAFAILTILFRGQNGEAYNVADEHSCVTIHELAELIAKQSGVNVIFEIPTNEESKGFSFIKNALFDTSKLQALGWQPQYNLERGISESIKLLQKKNVQ